MYVSAASRSKEQRGDYLGLYNHSSELVLVDYIGKLHVISSVCFCWTGSKLPPRSHLSADSPRKIKVQRPVSGHDETYAKEQEFVGMYLRQCGGSPSALGLYRHFHSCMFRMNPYIEIPGRR